MEIDSATLPWTPFNFVYFAAFNATGKAVYLEWRPVNMSVPPPVALVLGQGRSVEGDIDFSKLLFYEAASRDDLFLIWVTTVKLHRSSTQHATNYGFSEERVKGLTLVPKRRALKGE